MTQRFVSKLVATSGSDRPRERLALLGAEALSDAELLALLLGSSGKKGRDVLSEARGVLAGLGSIGALLEADLSEIMGICGLGPAKASRLKAACELGRRAAAPDLPDRLIQGPTDVVAWFANRIGFQQQEVFWVLGLDVRHRVLRPVRVAQGHLTAVAVHPREVFRPLIRMGAAAAILVHNHPSGDPSPSRQDLDLTARLVDAGRLLGLVILDHLIVTKADYVSLSERGLCDQN